MWHVSNWFSSKCCADAYVDDNKTYANCDDPETIKEFGDKDPFQDEEDQAETIIQTLKKSAQTLMSLVNMVGGLMAFYKCNWQLLS